VGEKRKNAERTETRALLESMSSRVNLISDDETLYKVTGESGKGRKSAKENFRGGLGGGKTCWTKNLVVKNFVQQCVLCRLREAADGEIKK